MKEKRQEKEGKGGKDEQKGESKGKRKGVRAVLWLARIYSISWTRVPCDGRL